MNDDERYADYLEGNLDDDTLDAGARAELDDLRRMLSSEHMWADPPAELADSIVAAVGATPREAAPAPPRPQRNWMRPVLAVAAALLVVVAVGSVLATRDSGGGGEQFALAATDVIAGASGEATVEATGSGLSISLDISDLPPAEPGTFYQAWMKGPGGSVPIGTFHARDGDGPIELWSGVDATDYPTMTVTIQQEGAGPESSGIVVLTGEIPDAS